MVLQCFYVGGKRKPLNFSTLDQKQKQKQIFRKTKTKQRDPHTQQILFWLCLLMNHKKNNEGNSTQHNTCTKKKPPPIKI